MLKKLLIVVFFLSFQHSFSTATKEDIQLYGFVENKGQYTDLEGHPLNQVHFKASAGNVEIFITQYGLTYLFLQQDGEKMNWLRTDALFLNTTIKKETIEKQVKPNSPALNFYFPHCPGGIMNAAIHDKIIVKDLYPNIDWELLVLPEGLKTNYIIHPGGDPAAIKVKYVGESRISTNNESHSLQLSNNIQNLTEGKLFSYTEENKREVRSQYQLNNNLVSFGLGQYDKNKTLIIDPPMLLNWSTYFGGLSFFDNPFGVVTDKNGNMFVTGYTGNNTGFPVKTSAGAYYKGTYNGGSADIYIAKFTNAGVQLWGTYYGGSSSERPYDIDVDGLGNLYLTGYTESSDFPVLNPGAGAYFDNSHGGGTDDAFILKFNSVGANVWSTFWGASGWDIGWGITADEAGNCYVTGTCQSGGAYTFDPGGGAYFDNVVNPNEFEAFILKFNSNCVCTWGTYYGGSTLTTNGLRIATDLSGNIYVLGNTMSSDFPVYDPLTGAYFDGSWGGASSDKGDAYLLKFNNAGVRQWATFLGGDKDDMPSGLTIDEAGNVFVVGNTFSSNFPVKNLAGAYNQAVNAGKEDGFIMKFNNAGNLLWSTLYGSTETDFGYTGLNWDADVVVDKCGNIFIAGTTSSPSFPLPPDQGGGSYYDNTFAGGNTGDMFILSLNPDGSQSWGTFYGGSDLEMEVNMDIDTAGCIFIATSTRSAGLDLKNPGGGAYYKTSISGSGDNVILKMCPKDLVSVSSTTKDVTCKGGKDGMASVKVTGCGNIVSYQWNTSPVQSNDTAVGLAAGTYTVTMQDDMGNTRTATVTIKEPSSSVTVSLPDTVTACAGDTAIIASVVTGGTPTYIYDWNGGASANDTMFVQVNINQTHTLVVTDSKGCKDTATVQVKTGSNSVATASADQIICLGDSILLNASGGDTYLWLPSTSLSASNIAAPMAHPTVTTIYTVSVSSGSCAPDTETVTISVVPAITASAGSNQTICMGDSIQLNATGGTSYQWLTDPSLSGLVIADPVAKPTTTTSYTVVVSSGSCPPDTAMVTITVTAGIVALASSDTAICEGSSVKLNASGGSTYLWSPATGISGTTVQNPVASPAASTIYTVTVSSGSCAPDTETVAITILPSPLTTISSSDTIQLGDSITLTASGGSSYSWAPNSGVQNPNSPSPAFSPTITTTYTVTITDSNGCKATELVTIFVKNECDDADPFLPNAFSPNNDGINDNLELRTPNLECIVNYHLTIFNRWGEKVFDSTDPKEKWDGTYKSQPCDAAVFDYFLDIELIDGNIISRKGNVSLVR